MHTLCLDTVRNMGGQPIAQHIADPGRQQGSHGESGDRARGAGRHTGGVDGSAEACRAEACQLQRAIEGACNSVTVNGSTLVQERCCLGAMWRRLAQRMRALPLWVPLWVPLAWYGRGKAPSKRAGGGGVCRAGCTRAREAQPQGHPHWAPVSRAFHRQPSTPLKPQAATSHTWRGPRRGGRYDWQSPLPHLVEPRGACDCAR